MEREEEEKEQFEYACDYCGDAYISNVEVKDSTRRYCPYCYAVKLGIPDPSWLPSIKKDDIDKKGFHKI